MQCTRSGARLGRSLQASKRPSSRSSRGLAVYAVGDGWTGSFGVESELLRTVPGHEDEYEVRQDEEVPPLLVYNTRARGPVTSVTAGWGHSAMTTSSSELLIAGRPHELSALLRLKRLPSFVRNYAVQQTLRDVQGENESLVSSFAGKMVSLMTGSADAPEGPWEEARRNSIVADWSSVSTPAGVASVEASAGLTAILTNGGSLFTFGLNHHGQCGTGKISNNVWTPQPVMGLSSLATEERPEGLAQEAPIIQVSLGFQHGLALNDRGETFSWGKGERGQLGVGTIADRSVAYASLVKEFRLTQDGSRQALDSPRIRQVAAGMNHSAALTEDNLVFVWGKNIATPGSPDDARKAVDSFFPTELVGLPQGKKVIKLTCGSHHTAVLVDDGSVWAVGISSDTTKPILEAVELIPSGMVDMPCRQFEGHFDRTTIVGKDGEQVLHVHLWEDKELREHAIFTPAWTEHLRDERIRSVHRGWLHTLIVTDD